MGRLWIVAVLVGLAFLVGMQRANAVGFENPDQAPRAQAQANAVVARVSDPSAIHYNPAGLTGMAEAELLVSLFAIRTNLDYEAPSGYSEGAEDKTFWMPTLYAGMNFKDTKVAIGVAANSPYGLGSEWSDTGFSRYVATNSELTTAKYTPAIACQFTPAFSAGVGLDWVNADTALENKIDFGALLGSPGSWDGTAEFDGDAGGIGYTVGFMYAPPGRHRFGLAYHSPVTLEFKGMASISNIPPPLMLPPSVASPAKTTIKLPAKVTGGYALRVTGELSVEFDVAWNGWSSFDEQKLDVLFPIPGVLEDQTIARDWDDTIVYHLGLEYDLTPAIRLRGGYAFAESPIPDSTFDTVIPNSDSHVVAVGMGWTRENTTFDFAYTAVFASRSVDRWVLTPTGPVDLSGDYDTFNSIFGLSVLRSF